MAIFVSARTYFYRLLHFFVCMACFCITSHTVYAQTHTPTSVSAQAEKTILIVSSYERGNRWGDELIDTLVEKLVQQHPRYDKNILIEYLLPDQLADANTFDIRNKAINAKYNHLNIDLYMTIGNFAFDFVTEHIAANKPPRPIIFADLDLHYQAKVKKYALANGHYRFVQYDKTIDAMYKLNPLLNKIYVITDESAQTLQQFKHYEKLYSQFEFAYLPNTYDQISAARIALENNPNEHKTSAILLGSDTLYLDKHKRLELTSDQTSTDLSIPTFCNVNYLLKNKESVGGFINDTDAVTQYLWESVLSRLDDQPVKNLYKTPGKYIFKAEKIILYNLAFEHISDDMEILNIEKLAYSHNEIDWISQYQTIRFSYYENYPPFSFTNKKGHPDGLGMDYLNLIAAQTTLNFTPIESESWSNSLEKLKSKEIDLILVAAIADEREESTAFSTPILSLPLHIIVNHKLTHNVTLDELDGRRIVIVKHHPSEKMLLTLYPNIEFIYVDTPLEGLKSVSFGDADAMIASLPITTHFMRTQGLTNLRAAGQTPFTFQLAIAYRQDWPILGSILNKSLETIDPTVLSDLHDKWLHVPTVKWQPTSRFIIFSLIGAMLFITLGFFIWRAQLQRIVKTKTAELTHSEHNLNIILENTPVPVMIMDQTHSNFIYGNQEAYRLFGKARLQVQESINWNTEYWVSQTDKRDFAQAMQHAEGRQYFEYQLLNEESLPFWAEMIANNITFKGKPAYLMAIVDITDRKQQTHELQQLAYTDSLTAVYNRGYFTAQAQQAIIRARFHHYPLAFFMLDLDHFKAINDTYGHAFGDQVLIRFAQVASSRLRGNDFIGRLGGEEFAIAFSEIKLEHLSNIAQRICDRWANEKFEIQNKEVSFTVSIGISIFYNSDESFDTIIDKADQALYQAKKTGRNRVVIFDKEITDYPIEKS